MFYILEDKVGPVAINFNTGLRIRPKASAGLASGGGVMIVFPDGNTRIDVRGDFTTLCDKIGAIDAR